MRCLKSALVKLSVNCQLELTILEALNFRIDKNLTNRGSVNKVALPRKHFKVKVKNTITDLDRSRGFHEVEAPRLRDNRHMKLVRLQAVRTGHFYPPSKYFCYSFLLEAESTPAS